MKLSIITINYNNKNGLAKTIDSVLSQSFDDYEWIVIDGGSTDGSKELIEKYSSKMAYWCSEPDKGVYHAMNKGIEHAKGEYLNFLNSGDWLCSSEALKNLFSRNPEADILSCNVIYMYDVPQRYMQCRSLGKVELSGWDFFYITLPHQGAFFKNKFFMNGLRYEESFKILGDLQLFFNMYFSLGASLKHYNDIDVACFDVSGISQTNTSLKYEEKIKIIRSFLSSEEFDFYKETLVAVNVDLRHNIKVFKILMNLLYYVAKLMNEEKSSIITFEESLLSEKIKNVDMAFYKKSEAIRNSRILWKLLNFIVNKFCYRNETVSV